MSRKQLVVFNTAVLTVNAGVKKQLTSTSQYVKSILVQAVETNTDFVYLGDTNNQVTAIAPGKALEIHGDALGHGDAAMFDISLLYIKSNVSGEGVTYVIMDGV